MQPSGKKNLVLRVLSPLLRKTVGPLKHFLWRIKPTPTPFLDEVTPDMMPQPLEGYADKPFYKPGETISFYLKADFPKNTLNLQRYLADERWEEVEIYTFQESPQPETFDEAQQGCHWTVSWQYILPSSAAAGYYRALLTNPALDKASEIHFLVGNVRLKSNVVVLAPVTTWHAYNAYGGQSLYRNAVNQGPVPFVSSFRPNTALTYSPSTSHQHNLRIEAHIFQWFTSHFNADLYPDFYLEANPEIFKDYEVVVLAYHAEYFSEQMYTVLRNLVHQQHASLLSLGGNQLYWRVKWHQGFTQVECRKDNSRFKDDKTRGSLWRHTPAPEAHLLGAQFTEAGMATFAPYQVLQPQHWLFKDTNVTSGQLFGMIGLDGLPICGDETDKTTWSSPDSCVVLAKGRNKKAPGTSAVYEEAHIDWDGAGGGEITFTELSETHAVLNTGSIQSGSGLGTDLVFTQLILNFMHRYGRTASRDTTS